MFRHTYENTIKLFFIIISIVLLLIPITIATSSSQLLTIHQQSPQTLTASSSTLYVGGSGPNNYTKIQDAINASVHGDTIFVFQGIYTEQLLITKRISLIGEKQDTTIIDGSNTGNIIKITQDYVNITRFTIQHGLIGIYILQSTHHHIWRNNIIDNWEGIGITQVQHALIEKNTIHSNFFEAINPIQSTENTFYQNHITDNLYGFFLSESSNNIINNNHLSGNTRGIEIRQSSNNNLLYHNNFYTSEEDHALDECTNTWNDAYPSGGNYWDDYTGQDNDGDGIGDTPYSINGGTNKDYYPLMDPYYEQQYPPDSPTISGPAQGKTGTSYEYTISTSDPEDDDVYYLIEWGDTTTTGWIGPFISGETIAQSHTWMHDGTYTIKVKAKDTDGLESDWTTLEVTMPMSKSIQQNTFFTWIVTAL